MCASLADTPAGRTALALDSVSSSGLGEFDPDRVASGPSSDLVAGVMRRFDGPLSGSSLFVLDPGDALLWLQLAGDAPPLDSFVDWGGRVLEGFVGCLAETLQVEVEPGAPKLEEGALLAALLGTHAPSDTVVLSLHGTLTFPVPVEELDEIQAPFGVHLLLEPKRIARILDALAAPGEPSA